MNLPLAPGYSELRWHAGTSTMGTDTRETARGPLRLTRQDHEVSVQWKGLSQEPDTGSQLCRRC